MRRLSPSQAARIIGCHVNQVRELIRTGILPARQIPTRSNRHGYRYLLRTSDVRDYADTPQAGGFPRGQKRRG